jgi:hypothetical protein
MTKKLRIYTDTSIFGGVFDEEFMEITKILFKQAKNGQFILCASEVVKREIENAPDQVKNFYNELSSLIEILPITEECIILRDIYIEMGVISKKYLDDALHVATATVSNCDIIVSWNFKHIVHFDKISLYNTLNKINGYKEIFINSPSEVIIYEN